MISQRALEAGGAEEAGEANQSVLSTKTWRVADAFTKLGLIRAGLGWGFLPLANVVEDLDGGILSQLVLEDRSPEPMLVPLSTVTSNSSPPGPAGRWLLDELATICGSAAEKASPGGFEQGAAQT